jgi:diadenosine tetraphosphate (Ap4A) HIT family hydrolase
VRRGNSFNLVPTAHAPSMSELPEEEMASMLAGLAKLVRWLEETYGVDHVELRTHPNSRRRPDHHFRLQVRLH